MRDSILLKKNLNLFLHKYFVNSNGSTCLYSTVPCITVHLLPSLVDYVTTPPHSPHFRVLTSVLTL